MHVLLCAGGCAGVIGFAGVGVGVGIGIGTCCMMVTGGGVGLLTDPIHRSRPVTPTIPPRISIITPTNPAATPNGIRVMIMLSNAEICRVLNTNPSRNRRMPR